MKRLLALFPNLTLEQSCMLWGIKFMGLKPGLSITQGEFHVLAVWDYEGEDEEKTAMRQMEVLRCHLMLAAYLMKYDPLVICKVLTWQYGEDEPAVDAAGIGIPLRVLAGRLPPDLEGSARTVCWFAHYLEQSWEDERARVFRLYNALGTLPGGFDGILTVSQKKEDIAILTMLLQRVETFHAQDNEEETYIPQSQPLSPVALDAVEDCYLRCLIGLYPQFRK